MPSLLVSKWVVRLLAPIHLIIHLHVINFIFVMVIVGTCHLSLFMHELLFHFPIGEVSSHLIHLVSLFLALLLSLKLLLCLLTPHPRFVRVYLGLIFHLLLNLFLLINFSQMRNSFCLFKLFLHQPLIHCLYPVIILLSL